MRFHIITLFPESIEPYLSSSILGRARGLSGKKKGTKPLFAVSYYNPRDFSKDPWKRIDQRPYGGGPGMVMEPESVLRAVQKAVGKRRAVIIFFSPSGAPFDAGMAEAYAKGSVRDIVFICGRYEGVDARVAKILKAQEVSVGPYVLTGGELPAAILVDAIARHLPGVLGDKNSLERSRKTVHKAAGAQDAATASSEVYTRPETLVWKGKRYRVPTVLLSGDHKAIEEWKKRTLKR